MSQFFVPRKNFQGPFFFFDPPESRHIACVLRKKSGEIVQIFDGEGSVFNAKLLPSDAEKLKGEILSHLPKRATKKSDCSIKIYPALYKGESFEWMLQKVTELGAVSIQPIITQRTIIKLKQEKMESRLERWKKIILSASKQSGRTELPEIFAPLKFEKAIRNINQKSLKLILWEGESKNRIGLALKNFKLQDGSPLPCLIDLILGPEGGFTIEEVESAKGAGFIPVRLTENILRAETAAIACVSYILLSHSN